MTPRIVREPLTGSMWIAHRPSLVWLAWLPSLCVIAAFGLGYFVGKWV
jgi:hypothetical protein